MNTAGKRPPEGGKKMALIELTLEGKIDKVKKAISRIQAYTFDVPVLPSRGKEKRRCRDTLTLNYLVKI